jgi:hypothetical protein
MAYYLLDHPPASQQFYPPPRANRLTGGVVVHTTESVMDRVDQDTGAENVASFIARRAEPGSYHMIVDSDSSVALVPDDYTAFHVAANGYNSRTWGISFACRSTELDPNDWWTQAAFNRAAFEIVQFWQRNGFDPTECAKFVPAADLLTGPGLTHHGEAQPWDRSDAFATHPQRPALTTLLVGAILDLVDPLPVPPGEEMKRYMMRNPKTGEIALFADAQPFNRVRLTPKQVEVYRFFGVEFKGDVDPFFFEVTGRVTTGA